MTDFTDVAASFDKVTNVISMDAARAERRRFLEREHDEPLNLFAVFVALGTLGLLCAGAFYFGVWLRLAAFHLVGV